MERQYFVASTDSYKVFELRELDADNDNDANDQLSELQRKAYTETGGNIDWMPVRLLIGW